MRRNLILLLLACSILFPWTPESAWSAEPGDLTIQPAELSIGTFYSGGDVTISGQVPDGQDVIVQITGPSSNGQFDVKGRVGPFWMTRGKAELQGAPVMYVLLLPGGEDWKVKAADLGLGLKQVKKTIDLHSDSLAPDKLFDMFLALKQSEGLYVVRDKAVSYTAGENGMRRFTAAYRFPRSTATGTYAIKATIVAKGEIAGEQSSAFKVEEVGFTRMVDDLATHRRLLYGILAVVIALFTGAVMGVLFKGGGGH